MRTGSLVVISVVAVLTTSLEVVAAMNASSVVGAEETKRRIVVLADREHVQAHLFGLLRDLHDRVDPFGLAGHLTRDRVAGDVADREDPELHVMPFLGRGPRVFGGIYAFACISAMRGAGIFRFGAERIGASG